MPQRRPGCRLSVFAIVNSSLRVILLVPLTLAGAGSLAQAIVRPEDKAVGHDGIGTISAAHAATFALLGGFRSIVADIAWIRLHTGWAARNLAATETLVLTASLIDPRVVHFWLNGARILAFDFPAWRIWADGGFDRVPVARQRMIVREQATKGIAHLTRGLAFHPRSAALWIERASLEFSRLGDPAAAAESYRRAAACDGAPYYAARLHAQMLMRLGRKEEALAWLVHLHPGLPAEDPEAAAAVVLERIRDLERELGVPATMAYTPPAARVRAARL